MVSRSNSVTSSYSCNDPCPPYYTYWISTIGDYVVISENANISTWQNANYDSGYVMGPNSVSAGWILYSYAASVNHDIGHEVGVTGEDADIGGDVTITA